MTKFSVRLRKAKVEAKAKVEVGGDLTSS